VIKKFSKEIEYCTFCPKMCRFVCPACEATGDEARTPTFRAFVLYRILNKKSDMAPDIRRTIYSCVLCRACKTVCAHGIDVSSYTPFGRAQLNKDGLADEGSKRVFERFLKYGNPYEIEFKNSLVMDTVFFPGCKYLGFYRETVERGEELLRYVGVRFTRMEKCCGFPLYSMGYIEEFEEHIKKLKKELRKVREIITACPTCEWFIREFVGFTNTRDLISIIAKSNPHVKNRQTKSFYYHDPCYRVRFLQKGDDIRYALSFILENPPHEFLFSKENTFCCGGGIMEFVDPVMVKNITKMRLKELKEGDSVITSCPGCRKNFENAGADVYDIIDLFYEGVKGGK
jgi:Fe-S oxidoreductase